MLFDAGFGVVVAAVFALAEHAEFAYIAVLGLTRYVAARALALTHVLTLTLTLTLATTQDGAQS